MTLQLYLVLLASLYNDLAIVETKSRTIRISFCPCNKYFASHINSFNYHRNIAAMMSLEFFLYQLRTQDQEAYSGDGVDDSNNA